MKTSIEKVGKLAAKVKHARERNMIGPTVVDLEVLEALLEMAAGQGAIVERLDNSDRWVGEISPASAPARPIMERLDDLERDVTAIEEALKPEALEARFETLESQIDRSARGEPDEVSTHQIVGAGKHLADRVAALEAERVPTVGLPGDSIALATRVAELEDRQRSLEDRWALEKAKRQALAAGLESIPDLVRDVVDLKAKTESIIRRVGDRLDRRFDGLGTRADCLERRVEVLEGNIRGALEVIVGPDEDEPDPTVKPPEYQALSEGYDDDLPTRREGTE